MANIRINEAIAKATMQGKKIKKNQALIRESNYETTKVWHELDLTKSRLFNQKKKEIKEFTIFDYI